MQLIRYPHPCLEAGVTLIEVLLTLVILSVGLLSLAGMQVIGLKSEGAANARSVATLIAADMAERIRGNPAVAEKAAQAGTAFWNVEAGADPDTDCSTLPARICSAYQDGGSSREGDVCTAEEMAAFDKNVMFCGGITDLAQPLQRAPTGLNALPSSSMTIVTEGTPAPDDWGQVMVTVLWKVKGADGSLRDDAVTVPVIFDSVQSSL